MLHDVHATRSIVPFLAIHISVRLRKRRVDIDNLHINFNLAVDVFNKCNNVRTEVILIFYFY